MRPERVRCEGDGCETWLPVGRSGPIRRYCKPCQDKRWYAAMKARRGAGQPVSIEELAAETAAVNRLLGIEEE